MYYHRSIGHWGLSKAYREINLLLQGLLLLGQYCGCLYLVCFDPRLPRFRNSEIIPVLND